jgi:FKBP-type peptidyl-prolyl cis-trans isomerase FkpA
MNKHLLSVCVMFVAAGGFGCKGMGGGGGGNVELKTEDDKTLYTLGLMMGRNAKNFDLTASELAIVQRGLSDWVTGVKPAVEIDTYGPKIGQLSRARMTKKSEAEKEKGKTFLASAGKESGAETTASGLVFKTEKDGTGESPKPTDRVKVNYEGKLADGTVFDSSYERKQPAEFSLSGVVRCWTEGLQKMKIGGKAKLTCPSTIAYGDFGHPPKIPGGAALQFEVELLEIKAPETPPAPGTPGAPNAAMAGQPGRPPMMPGSHPMPPMMRPPGAPGTPAMTPPPAKPPAKPISP